MSGSRQLLEDLPGLEADVDYFLLNPSTLIPAL